MKNYEVVSEQLYKFLDGSDKRIFTVIIIADTADDVPDPISEWAPGSFCIIAQGHQLRVLNTKGEWV